MIKRDRPSEWDDPGQPRQFVPAAEGEVETTLGADTNFKGTLTFERPLKIDGKFEGELTTRGFLIVGQSGEVHADIRSGNVVVDGKVSGNIVAEGKVQLNPTASLIGDIRASRLAIAEGATFVGQCDVNPAGADIQKPKPTIAMAPNADSLSSPELAIKAVKTGLK
ncbi:MAG: polymer-forming cytoskeletal protein [Candidatus Eisenbacteria bacterium]|jgi:cytoskeletal protein CcmA (bactofilin family)|nr:polymer-forming cytoskeletal protein [Candidatus Eisenbacteria bacterium]